MQGDCSGESCCRLAQRVRKSKAMLGERWSWVRWLVGDEFWRRSCAAVVAKTKKKIDAGAVLYI